MLYSRLFEELFSQKVEKSKYQGDKFSFLCQETLKLMEIESRKNLILTEIDLHEIQVIELDNNSHIPEKVLSSNSKHLSKP